VIRTVSRYLSIDRQIERYKEAYYLSLNRTSESFSENPKDYRISYFFDFLMKSIKRSFDDLKIYHQKWEKERQLSTSAKKVLECFRNYPEIRLTTKYLIEKTEMPRRTITKTLLQLTQLGFIQKLGIGAGTRYQITF
jgi:Fic family protein